jgi:CO/xanthine dehydrogenase FAD-binding subunit
LTTVLSPKFPEAAHAGAAPMTATALTPASPHRYRPVSLEEALAIRAESDAAVIAGGTDVYPALGPGAPRGATLDIARVAGLRAIARDGDHWRIGALATWTDLRRAALPHAFDGLKAAAREVGSVQIQNAATLAGNLCNASPAADGAPCLLTLDASVELASARGTRRLPLSAFLLGPRQTALASDELMTAILIPEPDPAARSAFLKLGARVYLVISIAMVAVTLTPDAAGRVRAARVAVGACSAVAQRLEALEAALIGAPMAPEALASLATEAHLAPLSPIDDVRADAAYRREAALELVRRALAQAARAEPAP